MSLPFDVRPHPHLRSDAEVARVLQDPGFGVNFTDHMSVASWSVADGWHDSAVVPYGPFMLDPAAAVLHYAQEIFEGLKAYRQVDGGIALFRPDKNAERFQRSARRLALPELETADFLRSIEAVVQADRRWVPDKAEQSLYMRPFMFASESFLGVRPAAFVTYCCIASPAGAYFASGVKPINIWITTTYTQPRRHRRGQVRRQLRGEPGGPAGGGDARLRPGHVRRRRRAELGRGARRHERLPRHHR
jgi:branched-chain amino acid aminotransferase